MAEKKADQMVAKMVGHLAEKTAAKRVEMTAVKMVRC